MSGGELIIEKHDGAYVLIFSSQKVTLLSHAHGQLQFRHLQFPPKVFCTLTPDLYSAHSTPVLPQWHIKDPSHSVKSAGGRLYLNMNTPFNQ